MWEIQSHVSVFTLNINICFAQCKHFVGTVQPTQHQASGVNTSLARAYNRSCIDIRITLMLYFTKSICIYAEIACHMNILIIMYQCITIW